MATLSFLALLAWVHLLLFHGGFWRPRPLLDENPPAPPHWPEVAAIIPARDEAESIGASARSHATHAYPGAFSLTVVDDNSTDGTGRIAAEAGARVISGKQLEAGWTGKLWALQQGVEAALRDHPDAKYLLLTDADIAYEPGVLQRLVAKAESENRAITSIMAMLDARGPWASILITAFIYFFRMLYPFARSNDPQTSVAAAAGGCVLIRRDALEAAGGLAAIKGEIIDDCALARLIKQNGYAIWIGHSKAVRSLRDNRSLDSIWNMVARTAFTQLRYSWLLLAGTVLGLVFLFAVPVLAALGWLAGIAAAETGLFGALAWALMSLSFAPTLRFYDKPAWLAPLLPVSAALYTAMTVSSALRHASGKGARWKGRSYPARG